MSDVGAARASSVVFAAVVDVVIVVVFSLVGRASHDEGLSGVFVTAWPFIVGLALGWLFTRAWRRPRRIVWTGMGIWVATLAGGMLLRVASGQGTAVAFMIVATLVLGFGLLGWRALAATVGMVRARR